jgi:hypothetical protein
MRSLQKQFAKAIRAALDAREMIHAVAKAAFAMQHSFLRITFAEKVQRSPEKKYSMNMRIGGAFLCSMAWRTNPVPLVIFFDLACMNPTHQETWPNRSPSPN